MNRKRPINEVFYDKEGKLLHKSSSRIFPQGNYQSIIYFNIDENAVDPKETTVTCSFQVEDFDATDELPMLYVGKFEYMGMRFDRWELPMSGTIIKNFSSEREYLLKIEFTHRELPTFKGFYDEAPDEDEFEENDIVYVFAKENGSDLEGTIQLVDGNWKEIETLDIYNIVNKHDVVSFSVARGLRVEKSEIPINKLEMLFSTLSKIQYQLKNLEVADIDFLETIVDNYEIDDSISEEEIEKYRLVMPFIENVDNKETSNTSRMMSFYPKEMQEGIKVIHMVQRSPERYAVIVKENGYYILRCEDRDGNERTDIELRGVVKGIK